MRACVRCGLWQAAAADGKCALCVALRWRATRACCARVRVGCACASACAARAPPVCAVRCALLCALFVQLGGAGLAGRAARWAAACCGWSRACLMVYGGRAARPTGSSAAQGASMRSALHVRLLRGWRVCFRAARDARMCSRCGRGRARGAAWSHRGPTPVGLRRDEGGRARGLAAIALPRRKKNLNKTNRLDTKECSVSPRGLST